jgi:bacterioferritin-associated ferredoxin
MLLQFQKGVARLLFLWYNEMYVCICAGITEKDLKELLTTNTTLEQLQVEGVCNDCCKCKQDIESIIEELCQKNSIPISK